MTRIARIISENWRGTSISDLWKMLLDDGFTHAEITTAFDLYSAGRLNAMDEMMARLSRNVDGEVEK